MNVSRPGARAEYSSVAALLGAALLVAAEFAPLLTVRSAAPMHDRVVVTVSGGSHHDWALLPIAVLAAGWSVVRWRSARAARSAGGSGSEGRPGSGGWAVFAVLGAVALAIALGHDLPDARATGLIGHAGTSYTAAAASPAIGFYLETLGGVVLLLTAAAGLLLTPRRARPPDVASRPRRSAS